MTLNVTLLAFILAAIIGVIVLIIRKSKDDSDGYVPFGPFLVISIFLMMILPNNYIIEQFIKFSKAISEILMNIFFR